ncbi:MAG: hypothetical protein IPM82_22310 [Saprospiraceae bacterium]|nr:hypothetical protein [Saprospiraceae bacterium]
MQNSLSFIVLVFSVYFGWVGCKLNSDTQKSVAQKFHPNDPFKSTMVPSQFFDIKAKTDNVVEGQQGTLMVLPKGCFTDSAGKVFGGNVKIELAEAFSLKDMLQSNLTTTSGGKPIITDGMIYWNATTADGRQLFVNKDDPIYIEIPTNKRQPGMMAYKGVRDEDGNMDWVEPKAIEQYLMPVDIHSLNFYPEGFETTVESVMPFNGHKVADKALKDSIFYSLSFDNLKRWIETIERVEFNNNEPHHNKHKRIENGKYTDDFYEAIPIQDTSAVAKDLPECGVDPASIKVIWSDKYQNTLLATREFEARMKWIHEACNTSILEIYVNNLDRNLWELDSMAAEAILKFPTWEAMRDSIQSDIIGFFHPTTKNEHVAEQFRAFAKQRLTKIKDGGRYAALLHGFYKNRLMEVKAELEAKQEEAIKAFREISPAAQKKVAEYKELLWQREKYRMDSYGFEWTNNGWINIDTGIQPKDWGEQNLEVLVESDVSFERVHTYVVYNSIKSIYRLNSTDNKVFYVGNADERMMSMPRKKQASVIAIGYKGDLLYMGSEQFTTGTPNLKVSLKSTTQEEITQMLAKYEKYEAENRIDIDLEYQAFFQNESKKKDEQIEVLKKLIFSVYRCCVGSSGPVLQSTG